MELSRNWASWAQPLDLALQRVTHLLAHVVQVQRATIWRVDGAALVCVDLYDAAQDSHTRGTVLLREDFPGYFSALDYGRVVDAADAPTDPGTRDLADAYLEPLGIGAMLDSTLRMAGSTWGVICIEHVGPSRDWRDDERRFAVSVADLVAQMIVLDEACSQKERLAELVAMQKSILDAAKYAIVSTDLDGKIRTLNRAAEGMLGYGAGGLIGRCTPALFHDPTELIRRAEELSSILGWPMSPDFELLTADPACLGQDGAEWTYVRKDGTRLRVRLSVTPTTGHDGQHNGYLCVATDTSAPKRAQASLRDSEARYQALFENAGDAIFLMRDGRFIDCNPATLRMFGCAGADIIGVTPNVFSPLAIRRSDWG